MDDNILKFVGEHSVEEMVRWAKSLRYFYVMGQYFSGHAEFYEQLTARIRIEHKEDFLQKIRLITILEPTPVKLSSFQNPIFFCPEYLQPYLVKKIGEVVVENSNAFINIGNGFFEISLYGNGQQSSYGISQANVAIAQRIEDFFEKVGLHTAVVHEIASDFNCISAVNYPLWFR